MRRILLPCILFLLYGQSAIADFVVWDFDSVSSVLGWTYHTSAYPTEAEKVFGQAMIVRNGILEIQPGGFSGVATVGLLSPEVDLPTDKFDKIELKVKIPSDLSYSLTLCWKTSVMPDVPPKSGEPGADAFNRSLFHRVFSGRRGTGDWEIITYTLKYQPNWKGSLQRLAIGICTSSLKILYIDYIKLFDLRQVSVEKEDNIESPLHFGLNHNYPNPFNALTAIYFELPFEVKTDVSIYDIRGKFVRKLVDKWLQGGRYRVLWDGKDREGRELSSGVYLYTLHAGDFSFSRKMVFVK